MRKFLLIIVIMCFMNIANANAIYDVTSPGEKGMEAAVFDYFYDCKAVIRIGKLRLDYRGKEYYAYRLIIAQSSPAKLEVKEITLMSEFSSISVPTEDILSKRREVGIDMTTDYIVCSLNPGDINKFIDGIYNKILIVIKDNNNKEYCMYAAKDYIDGLKKVSKWS